MVMGQTWKTLKWNSQQEATKALFAIEYEAQLFGESFTLSQTFHTLTLAE